ncbi:alpha/beta hydrolase [Kribbella solani]|uniref:alpha/beta hydrolase n=1 Tax=Kribbella solani TaxID=236067 RepID=UPI0029AD859D|nr:alpha/beta hydrolase [Kribbella solani]MDX2970757.1 alpha/beta hydrolase [Kribbella solani]MDX3006381.1 alpha/beta hydrolase [Kribbella solani]
MSAAERAAARGMMQKGEAGLPAEAQRAGFDEVFAERPLGADVTLAERTLGGVRALDVRVEGANRAGVILYLHGGGYVVGSARTGANLAAPLSRLSGVPAVSLDYRLAPEHPFPAAIHDALAAYRELVESGQTVLIAADSAGGGLALATLLSARAEGLAMPAGVVLFSPWTDVTLTGPSIDTRGEYDPLFNRPIMEDYAAMYLGGADAADELASPLRADLSGLPPLLVQVGSAEVLLDDALRLVARAAEQEVDVSLDVVAGAPHVFQYFAGFLPEADEALDRAATFIRHRLASVL